MKEKPTISRQLFTNALIMILALPLGALSIYDLWRIHKHEAYEFENHSEIQAGEIEQANIDSAWEVTNLKLTHGN